MEICFCNLHPYSSWNFEDNECTFFAHSDHVFPYFLQDHFCQKKCTPLSSKIHFRFKPDEIKALEMSLDLRLLLKIIIGSRTTFWIWKSGSKHWRFFKAIGSEIQDIRARSKTLENTNFYKPVSTLSKALDDIRKTLDVKCLDLINRWILFV